MDQNFNSSSQQFEDTSANIEPDSSDTSLAEPSDDTCSEDSPQDSKKLYAGKYDSVEELEKGYEEAQKFVGKASEYEKLYNELLAQNSLDASAQNFDPDFNRQVLDAEFAFYQNYLNSLVPPQHLDKVSFNLQQYYQTGDRGFLEAAKQFYPPDFIEHVALQKNQLENHLFSDFQLQQQQAADFKNFELAKVINSEFKDFLADIDQNHGKAAALKSFCDFDFINSKEDMQLFEQVYSAIAKYERELAIKEYEAARSIDNTKKSARIDSGAKSFPLSNTPPTYEQISAMSQSEFNAACDKYGLKTIISAK